MALSPVSKGAKTSWFNYIKRVPPVAKIIVAVIVIGGGYLAYTKVVSSRKATVSYQTATVERGTLITSVSGSGTISSGNSIDITTDASGIISNVYVKNGDTVKVGDKLADLELDSNGNTTLTKNWAAYLSAKNSLASAQTNKVTLQQGLLTADNSEQTAINSKYQLGQAISSADAAATTAKQNYEAVASKSADDPDRQKAQKALDAANAASDAAQAALNNYDNSVQAAKLSVTTAEQKYATADDAISQAQASLNSAWLSYQASLPVITAPASGVLTNFNLANGNYVNGITTSSTTSSNVSLGNILLSEGSLQASAGLTEIDIVGVTPGQKVTMTLDAFSGKTFTGKVLAINTNGSVSSGVTTYPVTIAFDTGLPNIYPNMAVSVQIITGVKDNVLLVPSGAVQTANGASTVRVMKNGQVTVVPVEVGLSNDTETEITAGLSEGDEVVTSTINYSTSRSSSSSTGTSPFSSTRNGVFGGGGVTRTVVGR